MCMEQLNSIPIQGGMSSDICWNGNVGRKKSGPAVRLLFVFPTVLLVEQFNGIPIQGGMSSDICWNARTGKKEVCRPPTCSCASFQLYYLWNSSMQFHSRAECSVTFAGMPSRKDLAVVGLRRGVFRFSNCGDVLFRILSRVRTMDHRCRRQLLLCRLHFLLGCTNDSFRLYFSLFWPFS
jgi:hypothetical protein